MGKPFLILSLLTLTLKILHVSSQGVQALNLACGATASFTDPYGNQWVPDYQFIGSGSTASVQFTSPDAPFLSTVRYFPYGSMNCYGIGGVTLGATIKVIAIFQYGNYDGLALPPSFLLQIDGGGWTSVQTSEGLVAYSLTFRAVEGAVSVCLAPDSTRRIPFISAIRVLEAGADSSTQDGSSDPGSSSSSQVPSEERVKFSSSSKVRAKGKLGGLIYLCSLIPGGFGVAVIILIIVYLIKKNKMRRAEIQAQLDAENTDSGASNEA
ncbi:uncharacterized protein At1g24485-like [Nymphaea colorata]|nr:uncharacterized protein At1g24485-like [Nymphaea colorata]